jgi:hypothetical protein
MSEHQIKIKSVMVAINNKYGSLESPKYTFVQEAIARKPYSDLVTRLSALADNIKEDTDPNDDVSFGYLLKKGVEQLFLQLSMVGNFAAVQRVHGSGSNELLDPGSARSDFEKSVIGHLKMADLVVLDDALLRTAVPLQLVNTEHDRTTVYQALFSDSESVPWL